VQPAARYGARAIALRLQYDAQWAINTRANHYNYNVGWARSHPLKSAKSRSRQGREEFASRRLEIHPTRFYTFKRARERERERMA